MESIPENKIIQLEDGTTLKLNERNLSIDLCSSEEVLESAVLEYPSAGYGGGSIHLSPSRNKVVFTYYSGQSEEAFTIFALSDHLAPIFQSKYYFGEAGCYCFSQDESLFVQALPRTCTEWWLPWEDGELEDDKECRGYFEFCDINILDLQSLELSHHIVRVKPAEDWRPPPDGGDPFLHPKFVSDKELSVGFPWGKAVLALPLPRLITYKLANA